MDMEKENIEELKNVDDRIRLLSLPLTNEDLSNYLGKFDQFQFIVDYQKSFDNLQSNNKILRYLSNCGIVGAYLDNFKLDENLEDLLLEYVKFDQEVIIPALSEIWISIVDLHPGDNQFFDKNLKDFNKGKEVVDNLLELNKTNVDDSVKYALLLYCMYKIKGGK